MSAEPTPQDKEIPHWLVRAFALFGLVALLGLVLIALAIGGWNRPYQPAKVAGAKPEQIFTLGNVEALRGTNLLKIDIAVSEGGGGGSSPYSGRVDDTRNILLFDKANGASRKLLPDNDRRIAEARFFSPDAHLVEPGADLIADDEEKAESPVAYYSLLVDPAKPGGDSELIVGVLSSARQGVVMRGIEGIDSMWMQSPTRIGMLVRERLALYHRIVDIPTLKVVQSRQVKVD